ncbi:hypothetical protein JVU11DRAFT_7541 [Chiua virens]|nr:hypothetical protein JVU11DRAFT_7541 [Chiua virens]
MPFQDSTLRVAGQDSDIVDIIFPSSHVSQNRVGAEFFPVQGKQMYGDHESIRSWIDAIDGANKCSFKTYDFDVATVFEFATHPFRIYRPNSPFPDESESDSDVSFCFDPSAWASGVFASSYDDGSDKRCLEVPFSDDAQYITIPSDSPWYRPPSRSPGPVSAHEFDTAAFAGSCSSDVRQAIAQQDLLLAIFHEELRRVLPHNDGAKYDPDWLEDVDADVVLAPLESYADVCWESAVSENAPSLWLGRPVPDVPVGFDDA